jgi:two-component system response regulator
MPDVILLAEDNPNDAELAIRALKKARIGNEIIHLEDGQEVIDYLYNENNQPPRLILLDLKMPRVDGLQVLKKLKSDVKKRSIPIVVLTSSKQDRDIVDSYDLGVNAYIVKPVDFTQFADAIAALGLFWIVHNQAPIVN